MSLDSAKVKTIITEVGEFITGLYHSHHAGNVLQDGQEVITVADVEGERKLLARLTALLPGSIGIGEEDVAARTKRGDALPGFSTDDVVWFVDPLDGTRSFKNKKGDFGIMVGLQQKGALTHGWIHFPVLGTWLEGEAGAGTMVDGERVTLNSNLKTAETEICIDTYHLPLRQLRAAAPDEALLTAEATAIARVEYDYKKRWPGRHSCIEARQLLTNDIGILCHANGLAWDNAAGLALYHAAGGVARLLDGTAYSIKSATDIRMQKRGLLYAPSEQDWQHAQAHFAPLRAYLASQNIL